MGSANCCHRALMVETHHRNRTPLAAAMLAAPPMTRPSGSAAAGVEPCPVCPPVVRGEACIALTAIFGGHRDRRDSDGWQEETAS